ncbi:MAG TPA: zinc metallopeptidase, partial [Anaerolineae bacterium]|nr:zinc metallopeptidase [Anaerolineae bacterium]
MFFPFYFDIRYLMFSLPALALALFAQWRVRSAYSKYSRVRNMRNMSGLEAAQVLLRANGLGDVGVQSARRMLGDHYDPSKKVLRLSPDVARTPSVAALGIVAHEVGHALQDQTDYAPLRVRSGLVPMVNLGTWMGMILFFVGLLIEFSGLVW